MKPLVLICSQDAELYLVFGHILEEAGFASELVGDAEEAIRLASEREAQAVILDCQPGSTTGAAICARLKSEPETSALPVVALIAPGAENQHLDLLKAGIDESFARPFAPAKLITYLRAELAMTQAGSNEDGRSLICGDLEMRLATHRVRCNGQEIPLGPIEFNLLRHLLQNPGKVFSRDELIGAAWPDNIHVDQRTVDVHISRLRKALKTVSPNNIIRTIRAAGYALEEQDQ